MSLNCLFYENHQLKEGLNPNSAFFVGFNSSDLEKIEQEVCNSIKESGRDYILVDAINKPYRRMLKEIARIPEDPYIPRMMNYEMINMSGVSMGVGSIALLISGVMFRFCLASL